MMQTELGECSKPWTSTKLNAFFLAICTSTVHDHSISSSIIIFEFKIPVKQKIVKNRFRIEILNPLSGIILTDGTMGLISQFDLGLTEESIGIGGELKSDLVEQKRVGLRNPSNCCYRNIPADRTRRLLSHYIILQFTVYK